MKANWFPKQVSDPTQVYILSQKVKAKHCTQNTTSEVVVHSRRILHQSNSMQQSRYMAAIYLIIA